MPGLVSDLSETWGGAPDERQGVGAAGFIWWLLPRHGKRPARFFGRALLRADNRAAAHALQAPCWSDVQAYEVFDGGFAVRVSHIHTADDCAGFQDVWQAASGAQLVAGLRNHEIAACMLAAAPHGIEAALRRHWHDLLNALFGRNVAP
jgi:hypothetical protein